MKGRHWVLDRELAVESSCGICRVGDNWFGFFKKIFQEGTLKVFNACLGFNLYIHCILQLLPECEVLEGFQT